MSYLLDTNIVSDGIKPQPLAPLAQWMANCADNELFLSVISAGEIKRGILELPVGRKRQALEDWYAGPNGLQQFAQRILPFDERAAEVWADVMASGRRKGKPRNALDMMIAAIAIANGLTVVSLNERDFDGVVAIVNPARL